MSLVQQANHVTLFSLGLSHICLFFIFFIFMKIYEYIFIKYIHILSYLSHIILVVWS